MKSVRDIPVLENVPVLVRASLNVPVEAGVVQNTFRLERALPTIKFLLEQRARVILVGHLGDKGTESLYPVYEALQKYLPTLSFCPVTIGEEARSAVRALKRGDVLLLENVRRFSGEKENDTAFARELASLGDVFVQDAFDVCHREHASVVSLPTLLPAYAGFSVLEEVRALSRALHPARPSLALVGGAKFSTKEPIITKLLSLYDHVFVGGALANDFLKQKGVPVEASMVSSEDGTHVRDLLSHPKLLLPVDAVSAPLGASREAGHIGWPNKQEAIFDIGPETVALLAPYIQSAHSILWNGPFGLYEHQFVDGTRDVARLISRNAMYRTWYGADKKKNTFLGGGDTVDVVEAVGASSAFSFISTGGGAMLDFLAAGTLPGLRVLST